MGRPSWLPRPWGSETEEPEGPHPDVCVPIVQTGWTLGVTMPAVAAGVAVGCADHGTGAAAAATGGARGRATRLRRQNQRWRGRRRRDDEYLPLVALAGVRGGPGRNENHPGPRGRNGKSRNQRRMSTGSIGANGDLRRFDFGLPPPRGPAGLDAKFRRARSNRTCEFAA